MAFHINTHDIPTLRCYSDAKIYWERIKPWRGRGDTNTRPLAGRNKSNMTIRKLNDDSIAMALWSTDVVTYHPDGDITLEAYSSVSTNMFARELTPGGIHVTFGHPLGDLVHLDLPDRTIRTYKMAGRCVRLTRKDDCWTPSDMTQITTIAKYGLDQSRARAIAKEYGFADYVAWCKALDALGQPVEGSYYMSKPKVPELLKQGMEGWVELRKMFRHDTARARDSLYAMTGCIKTTHLPYVEGYSYDTIVASRRRWSALYYLGDNK